MKPRSPAPSRRRGTRPRRPGAPPGPAPEIPAARVLGIDPGTLAAGYALVEERQGRLTLAAQGTIRPPARLPIASRLLVVHDGLRQVLAALRPAAVAVELTFVGRGHRSSLRLGEGRGAALVAAAAQGVPVFEYPPATIKKAVTGNGQAGKEQVQQMVRLLCRCPGLPLAADAADAAAVAVCHLNRARWPAPPAAARRHRKLTWEQWVAEREKQR